VAAAHTKAALAALDGQLIAPIDNQLGKQITGEPLQIPPAGAIYGVTHFAILPDKTSAFSMALISYTAATRRAAGNLRYFPAQDISALRPGWAWGAGSWCAMSAPMSPHPSVRSADEAAD
jgi:hypothetical protein